MHENENFGWPGRDKVLTAYIEHRPAMVRRFLSIVGNFADAEDAVSEAFLRALDDRPADIKNIRAWLFTVARRAAVDIVRARKSEADKVRELSTLSSGEHYDGVRELRIRLDTHRLVELCRPLLTDAELDDLWLYLSVALGITTEQELAKTLEIPAQKLKERRRRPREAVRDAAVAVCLLADLGESDQRCHSLRELAASRKISPALLKAIQAHSRSCRMCRGKMKDRNTLVGRFLAIPGPVLLAVVTERFNAKAVTATAVAVAVLLGIVLLPDRSLPGTAEPPRHPTVASPGMPRTTTAPSTTTTPSRPEVGIEAPASPRGEPSRTTRPAPARGLSSGRGRARGSGAGDLPDLARARADRHPGRRGRMRRQADQVEGGRAGRVARRPAGSDVVPAIGRQDGHAPADEGRRLAGLVRRHRPLRARPGRPRRGGDRAGRCGRRFTSRQASRHRVRHLVPPRSRRGDKAVDAAVLDPQGVHQLGPRRPRVAGEVVGFARVLDRYVDVEADFYRFAEPGVDWSRYGPRQIARADTVLVVSSAAYWERWEGHNPPNTGAGTAREADTLHGSSTTTSTPSSARSWSSLCRVSTTSRFPTT